jgi:hypothetical protein
MRRVNARVGRFFTLTRLLSGVILTVSCAATTTWRSPGFAGPPLRKVLICSEASDEVTRGMTEDAFVRELAKHGVVGVPCDRVVPPGERGTRHLAEAAALTKADGIIVTEPANVRLQLSNDAGPGETDPPYLDGAVGSLYGPGVVDTVVDVQARAYSTRESTLRDRELIWAGTSQSYEPGSVKAVVSRAVPGFVEAMVKAGVLPPSVPKRAGTSLARED